MKKGFNQKEPQRSNDGGDNDRVSKPRWFSDLLSFAIVEWRRLRDSFGENDIGGKNAKEHFLDRLHYECGEKWGGAPQEEVDTERWDLNDWFVFHWFDLKVLFWSQTGGDDDFLKHCCFPSHRLQIPTNKSHPWVHILFKKIWRRI